MWLVFLKLGPPASGASKLGDLQSWVMSDIRPPPTCSPSDHLSSLFFHYLAIHSKKFKIIHSKKILIQVKNRLSPRARGWWGKWGFGREGEDGGLLWGRVRGEGTMQLVQPVKCRLQSTLQGMQACPSLQGMQPINTSCNPLFDPLPASHSLTCITQYPPLPTCITPALYNTHSPPA